MAIINLRIGRTGTGAPQPGSGLIGAMGGTVPSGSHEEIVEVSIDGEGSPVEILPSRDGVLAQMASAFVAAFPVPVAHAEYVDITTETKDA